jgi:hypothetical protein
MVVVTEEGTVKDIFVVGESIASKKKGVCHAP